jgi:1-deoxy-D-xylulose 5-phosphate reductoisomerase
MKPHGKKTYLDRLPHKLTSSGVAHTDQRSRYPEREVQVVVAAYMGAAALASVVAAADVTCTIRK